jgi:hypothetical protein
MSSGNNGSGDARDRMLGSVPGVKALGRGPPGGRFLAPRVSSSDRGLGCREKLGAGVGLHRMRVGKVLPAQGVECAHIPSAGCRRRDRRPAVDLRLADAVRRVDHDLGRQRRTERRRHPVAGRTPSLAERAADVAGPGRPPAGSGRSSWKVRESCRGPRTVDGATWSQASAGDVGGEPHGAAVLDRLRDLMPVEAVGVDLGQQPGECRAT